jgi:hypothetical protein
LIDIPIPTSVKSIANQAFHGCSSIETIDIPNSVKDMGGDVFENCSSLMTVFMRSGTPPNIKKDTFPKSVIHEGILYVPNPTPYRSDPKNPWSQFRDIKAIAR